MITRDQAKETSDKILNMASGKSDAAEVNLQASERSGTRWANSSITVNLTQYDRNATVTVRKGNKTGNASTRDWSDTGLQKMVDEAVKEAEAANELPSLPELLGAQEYIPVDGAGSDMIKLGPLERARWVRDSIDMAQRKGVLGAGFIPKNDNATLNANSKGLFAYYRTADIGFILTCRMADGTGSGWSGTMGVKDPRQVDAKKLTEVAADKALKSRRAKAIEPGRYTVILEPRANARFLSLMTGIFNPGGGFPGAGGGGGGGAPGAETPPPPAAGAPGGGGGDGGRGGGGGGGGGGLGGGIGGPAEFMRGKKVGDKIFSELFTLKSDIGNATLRQSPINADNKPAKAVTWVDKGVLGAMGPGQGAGTNQSLVQEGSNLSIEDMIKQTRRGLLVTSMWYIRGVPSQQIPLLNTGMTRDGLFLIENGELAGPVQNFRWNMSPVIGYSNLTLVGKPVPMEMGEAFGSGNAALIPPVRIEEFYMTSVSPAV
jgi:predicted Zn-dependent protease